MAQDKFIETEIKQVYSLIVPKNLEAGVLDQLGGLAEKLLIERKQDIVLSLRHIETVFSVHLTVFVQLYKLLKSFNLKFVIVDISPAVLNVMQMTQLENLLPLFLSIDHYEESLADGDSGVSGTKESLDEEVSFSYQISNEQEPVVVYCEGYMAFGEGILRLQELLDEHKAFTLDFEKVGYIDTRVLILLSDMAEEHFITIANASNVLIELFEQHHILEKFTVLD
jgi:anti-anti-sigma factor